MANLSERPNKEDGDYIRKISDKIIENQKEVYFSSYIKHLVKKEVDSKIKYILLAWEIFTESFKSFEDLIQNAFDRVEFKKRDLPILTTIIKKIIASYSDIFENFTISAKLNCETNRVNITTAADKASHNMNIMAFHQMCAVLSLSLQGKTPDEIAVFIDEEKIKTLFMYEQYLGRYSNILATGVPTLKINSDGTPQIKLSREFKLGDITGMPELMKYLNDSVRPTMIRTKFNDILKALQNQLPDSRSTTIHKFSSLLIDIDAQKVITDKFVEQFKKYQQLFANILTKTTLISKLFSIHLLMKDHQTHKLYFFYFI